MLHQNTVSDRRPYTLNYTPAAHRTEVQLLKFNLVQVKCNMTRMQVACTISRIDNVQKNAMV